MRQLVRDQRIALEVEMRARVVQRAFGLRRRRRVFHPAENKIADRDLRILGVRVGHADHALEKLDHLRRVAKGAARIVLAAGRNVVGDRSVARALSDQRELAGRQRDQIGRVRHLVTPVKGAGLLRVYWWTCRSGAPLETAVNFSGTVAMISLVGRLFG